MSIAQMMPRNANWCGVGAVRKILNCSHESAVKKLLTINDKTFVKGVMGGEIRNVLTRNGVTHTHEKFIDGHYGGRMYPSYKALAPLEKFGEWVWNRSEEQWAKTAIVMITRHWIIVRGDEWCDNMTDWTKITGGCFDFTKVHEVIWIENNPYALPAEIVPKYDKPEPRLPRYNGSWANYYSKPATPHPAVLEWERNQPDWYSRSDDTVIDFKTAEDDKWDEWDDYLSSLPPEEQDWLCREDYYY